VSEQVAEKVFRVKSTTAPLDLGSAIARVIYDGQQVVLRAVGAGAVNQAVKAIPVAQSFAASYGIDLIQRISFFHAKPRDGETDSELVGIAIRVQANI
jgi:stage V sporulation protein S